MYWMHKHSQQPSVPCTFAHWRTIYKLMLFYTLSLVLRALSRSLFALLLYTHIIQKVHAIIIELDSSSLKVRAAVALSSPSSSLFYDLPFGLYVFCLLFMRATDHKFIRPMFWVRNCRRFAHIMHIMWVWVWVCVRWYSRIADIHFIFNNILCIFACKKYAVWDFEYVFPWRSFNLFYLFVVLFSSLCFFLSVFFLIICSSIYSLWYGHFSVDLKWLRKNRG